MKVILTATSPIAHGAFGPSTGNMVGFRRIPVVGHGHIPAVSGNALRGTLRRLVMRQFLAAAGMDKTSVGWDELYAALVNGGHLQGSESSLDPRMIAELRIQIPPLSVFGAALKTWMLEGRVEVGICWPRCSETYAAGLVGSDGDGNAEDLVSEMAHVRHVDRAEQCPEVTGVTPMPTTFETLSVGTVLESDIRERGNATDIEIGAIAHGLDMLSTIGGKSGAGLGRVVVQHDGDANPYREWLDSMPAETVMAVAEVANRLSKRKLSNRKKKS